MIIFHPSNRQATRPSRKHPVQDLLVVHTWYSSLPNKGRQASDIWSMDLQTIRAGTVLHGRLHERSPEFNPHDAVLIIRNAGWSSELCVGEHSCTLSGKSVASVLHTNGPNLAFHEILKVEPVATLCSG